MERPGACAGGTMGVAAWRLVVTCHVLGGGGGNLYDALGLAVVAALGDTKLSTTTTTATIARM